MINRRVLLNFAAQSTEMDKRARAPLIHQLIAPRMPAIRQWSLQNGMPVYEIRTGTQDILKIEVLFRAGRPFEPAHQVARFTCQGMREGTSSLTGAMISEHFDYYGSSLVTSESLDHSGFVLYCLKKHLPEILPVMADILLSPSFDPAELDKLKRSAVDRLKLDLSKNDFLAYREFTSAIFGADHPYGYNSTEETLRSVSYEALRMHHSERYVAANGLLMVSGKVDDEVCSLLDEWLGKLPAGSFATDPVLPLHPTPTGRIDFRSQNKHQVALRIGRRLFTRDHADFNGMYVLNTILGGYFGSRLMMNLREDMGVTYNIYSSLDTMLLDGLFLISMETDPEYLAQGAEQIYAEMDRLCNEPVEEEELSMVRNYILGYLLTAMDGPLHVSELVKGMLLEGVGLGSFDELVSTICHIQPNELQELAVKYLRKDDMLELVVSGN